MPKVSLPQKSLILSIESNSNLMNALLAAGVPVASSCHGEGICSMCKVKIQGTVNPALNPAVNPPEKYELETLKRNRCEADERLSCQIAITNDLTVTAKYW